jgi:hypothetical protein
MMMFISCWRLLQHETNSEAGDCTFWERVYVFHVSRLQWVPRHRLPDLDLHLPHLPTTSVHSCIKNAPHLVIQSRQYAVGKRTVETVAVARGLT